MPRANGGRNVRHSTTLRMLEERDMTRYSTMDVAGANAATAVASGARLIWAAVRADLATALNVVGG